MAGKVQNDLTGKVFDNWSIDEYLGRSKYKAHCLRCGAEKVLNGYFLSKGEIVKCQCETGKTNKGRIDLTGKHFGSWEVISYAGNKKWLCRCHCTPDCGVEREVAGEDLRNGKSTGCGRLSNHKFNDLTGQRFGDWLVIEYNKERMMWLCECSCEQHTRRFISGYALKSGQSTSCGHSTTGYKDLTGMTFGNWDVLHKAELQTQSGVTLWTCRCKCSKHTVMDVSGYALRSGKSRSCGCLSNQLREQTNLAKYGVKYSSQVSGNFSEAQLEISNNKEALKSIIDKFESKPSITEVAALCNLNRGTMYGILKRHDLLDAVSVGSGPSSGYEEQINSLFPCNNRHNRKLLGDLEIDLYYPEQKFGIEFNGTFWHSSEHKEIGYHLNKTKRAASKGVQLMHIFEYEWNDPKTQKKLIELISKRFKNDKIVIGARDCEIKNIDTTESVDILNEYHLQGYVNASIVYGAYYNNKLIGVMSFGRPRFNSSAQYELLRLVWDSKYYVSGGSERLFKAFIKEYNPESVITYCDISKFSGRSYRKIGFKLIDISRPNYRWVNPNTGEVVSRYQAQKEKLVRHGLGSNEQTENDIMSESGFYKVYDCGNFVFEWRAS